MVELVDTYALGAYAERCAVSSPVPGTIIAKNSSSSRASAFFIAIIGAVYMTPLETILICSLYYTLVTLEKIRPIFCAIKTT